MKMFRYFILQYRPSMIADEKVNLGVIVHCVNDDIAEFIYIKGENFEKRLKSFDDELNIDTVKTLLKCISDNIQDDYNSTSFAFLDFKKYVRGFNNKYTFTVAYEETNCKSMAEMKKELIQKYLRFYLPKDQRIY